MKYFLAAMGMLIGRVMGEIITASLLFSWIAGVVLGLAAYQLPDLLKYRRASPKELLSFHGPDSRITSTASSKEIRAFLSQLHDGGLLIEFEPSNPNVQLDYNHWMTLSDSERLTLCRVLTRVILINGNLPREIKLWNDKRKNLGLFDTSIGRLNIIDERIFKK